jgi:hypothetical protein
MTHSRSATIFHVTANVSADFAVFDKQHYNISSFNASLSYTDPNNMFAMGVMLNYFASCTPGVLV